MKKKGKIELDTNNKILYINETCLKTLNTNMTKVLDQTKKDIRNAALIELNSFYPEIQRPIEKYNKDDLSKVLKKWNNDINEFSDNDKKEIMDLFNKLTSTTSFITNQSLSNTKNLVDKKFIENTVSQYKELQQQTSDTPTLEKKWQKFLEDNTWIFGTIFAQPIILFQREAYVGGKSIDNSNGKFTDFLLKNKLTNNVSFFEIKTHLTKLVDDKPYRGSDVFTTSKELNSCISQVLNQRDNFQKEFCIHQYKSKNNIESFNSQCIVLIGSLSKLNDEQKKSFELFRNNSSSVEILTFDEVLTKLETFLSLLG